MSAVFPTLSVGGETVLERLDLGGGQVGAEAQEQIGIFKELGQLAIDAVFDFCWEVETPKHLPEVFDAPIAPLEEPTTTAFEAYAQPDRGE
jgi:hypothetical protein